MPSPVSPAQAYAAASGGTATAGRPTGPVSPQAAYQAVTPTGPVSPSQAYAGSRPGINVVHSAPKPQGGGGLWGDITGALGTAGHVIGQGAEQVANVSESIGTGIYKLGKDVVAPSGGNWSTLAQAWENPLFGKQGIFNPSAYANDPAGKDAEAIAKSTVASAEHPLRDPVATALNAFAVLSLGAGTLARVGYAGKVLAGADVLNASGGAEDVTAAGRATLAGKALNPRYKVPTAARTLKVTKNVALRDEEGNVVGTREATSPVNLHASSNHLVRGGQSVIDKAMQAGLDRGTPGLQQLARLRVRGSFGEQVRQTTETRGALENALLKHGGAARLAGKSFGKGISKKEGQLAVMLRSARVRPEEASAEFSRLADNPIEGADVGRLRDLAKTSQSLADKGVLKVVDDQGTLRVDADRYEKLAKADELVRLAQERGTGIINRHDLMTSEGATSNEAQNTRKALVAETLRSENARNPETGVRQGEGYTSLRIAQKRGPKTILAAARKATGIVPEVKKPTLGPEATGRGILKGLIPKNTIGDAAQTLHDLQRYDNTSEYRGQLAKQFGSDIKTHPDEILARDPSVKTPEKLSLDIEQELGRKFSTLAPDASTEERIGLAQKARELIEGRSKTYETGTEAPRGYKWIHPGLIPTELSETAVARGAGGKLMDNINKAVTAATVYFRVGHLPTRAFTDATTNLIEGSLNPIDGMGKNVPIFRSMTEQERLELVAATGPGGYRGVLPSQVQGALSVGIVARGANMWHRLDALFRANSALYQLRDRGLNMADPAVRKDVLSYLKDPHSYKGTVAWKSKVDAAMRDSRRESIMYDGLNNVEKQYISRVMWFYPWIKGAARWSMRVAAEHPIKAATGVALGEYGAAYRKAMLGNVPTYEYGLTPVNGGKGQNPLTSNFSSFTPASTLGQVVQMIKSPTNADTGAIGAGTPVVQAAGALYAGKGAKAALGQLVSSTPEYQIANAALHPQGKGLFPTSTNRMFGSTGSSEILRALFGAGVPRRTSKSRLAIDALHQKQKVTDIKIYSGG